MRTLFLAVFAVILLGAAGASASPCSERIQALEQKLNTSGASTTDKNTPAADSRTGKAHDVLEDAKSRDKRGDVQGCNADVDKATRETGSAQQ